MADSGKGQPTGLRRAAHRFGWGLADQGMSSLSNAAMSFYIARELGASTFGAFSLAYVTYSFALNASRGLATDPLAVRFSNTDQATWRQAVAECTGTALLVGLVTGACVLVAAVLLSGTPKLAFLALGMTLPALLLQDSWRYSFFAAGRGSQAFLNDTIWTACLLPAFVLLRITHHADVFWFVLAWGVTAAIAACAGPLQARVIPSPWGAWSWMSKHRDLGPRYLAENTSNAGASQLRTYGIGILAGLAAVGYVQAAGLLMGPFLVVFMGISAVTVPEAARILRRAPQYLQPYCLLVGGGLAVVALAWGAALLVALPRGLGALLLGGLWVPTDHLVIPLTISVMGACLTVGATAGLHALGAARRSLRAMVFASLIYLGFGLAGAAHGGALGTVRGVALATWIGALLWWWQLHVAMRESGIPVSLVVRPGEGAYALGAAYAAPLSARLRQSSNLRVTVNGNDSIDRQPGIAAVAGAHAPDPARAVSMGAGTADQLAHAAVSTADDDTLIAAASRGEPPPGGSGDKADPPADTGFTARSAETAGQGEGDDTVVIDTRAAYARYRTPFLPLDTHDDLTGYQWDYDEFGGAYDQEFLPVDLEIRPSFTHLPYIGATVRRLAWLWCAIGVIGALAGAAAYKAFPPAHAQAATSILLTTNPADTPTNAMPTEMALAQSRPVAELALSKLGLTQSLSLSSFLKAYTVTSTTDRVLTITVSAPSGSQAVNEANALATEFLDYRQNLLQAQQQAVVAGLQQQVTQAEQTVAAISSQISQVSAQPSSPAQQARLGALQNQRSQAKTALTQIEQTASTNRASTEVATQSMVRGSVVLNAAATITHSRLKQALVNVIAGLAAGLALGLGIAVVQALVSDRPRWRDDVTRALGAPVRLSVGTVRVRRWAPRSRKLAVARGRDVRRIVSYLRTVVYGQRISSLALVSMDNDDAAALALISLALSCAHENKRVMLADLSDGTRAAYLMGSSTSGIETVTLDDNSLVVAVPDGDAVPPVGPLGRAPAPGLPLPSEELTAAYASADLLFTLVSLDPSMGAEYLATWASDAVVLVTAGQSSATRIHAAGELIRLAGVKVISAVLVGADKSDDSLGITGASSQLAPADQDGQVNK